jgi:hypothetical protein
MLSLSFEVPFVKKLLDRYKCNLIKQVYVNSNFGEITLGESIFLGELVRCIDETGPIIEIGTLFGKSTIVITSNKPLKSMLITVDNYSWNPLGLSTKSHFRITKHILSDAEKKFGVKILNIDKNEFYFRYSDKRPSMVFFDADHSYEETKKDILWAKDKNAKLICGHDYDKNKHPDVVQAVDDFGGPKKLVESLWVL